MVTPQVIEMGSKHHATHHDPSIERSYVESCLVQDDDGNHYVDYFRGAADELDDPECDIPLYMGDLRTIIETGLLSHDPRVRPKYIWMREKYNTAARVYRSPSSIEGLSDADLHEAYLAIEDIPE